MNRNPLTLDDIRAAAPSAFAITKHSSRSDKYAYISTVEIINALVANGFSCYEARQNRTSNPDKQLYCKHMLRFRSETFTPTVQPGRHERCSITFPEITVVGSHDGSSAVEMMLGLREQVCWNGLIVDKSLCASVKIRHMGTIDAEVMTGAEALMADSARVLDHIEPWGQLRLSPVNELEFARMAYKARFLDEDNSVTIQPEALLARRRTSDAGHDLWTVFNVVQENSIAGGLVARKPDVFENGEFVRRGRQTKTRPVSSIATDLRVNAKLWRLAQEFATELSA